MGALLVHGLARVQAWGVVAPRAPPAALIHGGQQGSHATVDLRTSDLTSSFEQTRLHSETLWYASSTRLSRASICCLHSHRVFVPSAATEVRVPTFQAVASAQVRKGGYMTNSSPG